MKNDNKYEDLEYNINGDSDELDSDELDSDEVCLDFDSNLEEDIEEDEFVEDLDKVLIEDCENNDSKKESKHKEVGKHSLKYDSIFKGKKDESELDEYIIETSSSNNNFELDTASSYSFERESPTEYTRLNNLKNELYTIIVDVIKLNIKNSRRKPSRVDFNKYYSKIVENLDMGTYSYSEVFIEFAYYFSDNIENMFKLLDKKWGGKIAHELTKKSNINGVKKLDEIDFL